jgi:hypothetical protein
VHPQDPLQHSARLLRRVQQKQGAFVGPHGLRQPGETPKQTAPAKKKRSWKKQWIFDIVPMNGSNYWWMCQIGLGSTDQPKIRGLLLRFSMFLQIFSKLWTNPIFHCRVSHGSICVYIYILIKLYYIWLNYVTIAH